MVKRVFIFFLLATLPSLVMGQDHLRLLYEGETDFDKIEAAFYEYWERNGKKDSEYRKFKRWEYFVKPRFMCDAADCFNNS